MPSLATIGNSYCAFFVDLILTIFVFRFIVNSESNDNALYFDESKRSQLQTEVVQFISSAAKTIQAFTNQLDDSVDSLSSSQLQYNQQVISQLMHVSFFH